MLLFLPPLRVPRLESLPVYGQEESSAFSRGKHERPLRLIVDDLALVGDSTLDVLMALKEHSLVDILTTSRTGPSVVTMDNAKVDNDAMPVVVERQVGSRSQRAVWPASTWLTLARQYHDRRGGNLADTERRFLLAGAADSWVDGLVLDDTDFGSKAARQANPLGLTEAAALIGLFLRSREEPTVLMWDSGSHDVEIGTQRFIVSRCLLHAGWRWWSACVATGQTTVGRAAMRIGQGLHTRFERSLRARDEVMVECLRRSRGRGIDRNVLYHFDAMLLWLGGAFDTTALVADHTYALGTPAHRVGWRRKDWRQALASTAPTLHTLTELGSPVRAVIDLVATFRNTIHGEPVTGVTYSSGTDQERGLIQLPVDSEAEAVQACQLLGGKEMWGFVREGTDPIGGLWDPHIVVQVLLPFAAAALNIIMSNTEVERLPGVTPRTIMTDRPSEGFFDPDIVRRLLCLHGFPV